MRTKYRVVQFNTGKYGVRSFNLNFKNFGWDYLYKSPSEKICLVKLCAFSQERVQFDNPEEAMEMLDKLREQNKVTLKVKT